MNLTPSRTGKFLSSQIRYCFAMDRKFKIAVICLLAVALSGCISSNPSSEVMVDTNAKRKQALPGEAQNVGPLPQAYEQDRLTGERRRLSRRRLYFAWLDDLEVATRGVA